MKILINQIIYKQLKFNNMQVYVLFYYGMPIQLIGVYSSIQKVFDALGFECPIDPDNYEGVSHYIVTETLDNDY